MSKLTLITSVIIPAFVIICTIALPIAFTEEKTSVFWFNICYGVFLELIFFGFIGLLRQRKAGKESFTGAFYAIMGTFAGIYVLIGFMLLIFSTLPSIPPEVVAVFLNNALSGVPIPPDIIAMFINKVLSYLPLLPFKAYVVLVVILTLAWLVLGSLIAETDKHHKDDIEITKAKREVLLKRK